MASVDDQSLKPTHCTNKACAQLVKALKDKIGDKTVDGVTQKIRLKLQFDELVARKDKYKAGLGEASKELDLLKESLNNVEAAPADLQELLNQGRERLCTLDIENNALKVKNEALKKQVLDQDTRFVIEKSEMVVRNAALEKQASDLEAFIDEYVATTDKTFDLIEVEEKRHKGTLMRVIDSNKQRRDLIARQHAVVLGGDKSIKDEDHSKRKSMGDIDGHNREFLGRKAKRVRLDYDDQSILDEPHTRGPPALKPQSQAFEEGRLGSDPRRRWNHR